jgi:hypothetical protein
VPDWEIAIIILLPIGIALGWYLRGAAEEARRQPVGPPSLGLFRIITDSRVPRGEAWLVDDKLVERFKLGGQK